MKITAALTKEIGSPFELEEIELAAPKASEVLIKIVASGVCHTDATVRDTGMTPFPAVLGHEGSGIVEAVGDNVHHFAKGDHVVMSFASCGECKNCKEGHPAYCYQFMPLNMGGKMEDGTSPLHHHGAEISNFFGQSSFGTFAIVHERNLVKVDQEVELALLGPLGCGIQTGAGSVLNVLKPAFGSSIAVFGAGGVGLSAVMAAKIAGCEKIIVVDVHEQRLKLARELGATHVINGKEANAQEELMKITGVGVNYVVETTGVGPVVLQAIRSLAQMGEMVSLAAMANIEVPFMEITGFGRKIMGVTEGDSVPHTFIPKLISYYKNGQFPFDKLVKYFEFDQINDAFAASKSGEVIKPILKMN
ncbi:NAD(P)-dependent alcohol dehydrogenase [Paenibacillus glycanilyticus]|uniref:Alcohol dehydrogenase n=1 Tax=Paenibacillus glycanilyticus TaxID=126569 RepID=A0ABQ6GFU8_9BACL|nr:NAD(P)-dependent alcohol dehydrogenase [Paenibacillus glycanilyticus]GLX69779.1 alcohol dehydrogenase [Paenibacillus glycanilyticus]